MMRTVQSIICCGLLITLVFTLIEARPQSAAAENIQELDTLEPQIEDARSGYYDLPAQSLYQDIPLNKLQMLVAQYKPAFSSYQRSSGFNGDDMFRMPESKRQVRYRQCYFNPISCFKK